MGPTADDETDDTPANPNSWVLGNQTFGTMDAQFRYLSLSAPAAQFAHRRAAYLQHQIARKVRAVAGQEEAAMTKLAGGIGLESNYLGKILRGTAIMRLDHLCLLAEFLDDSVVDVDFRQRIPDRLSFDPDP